MAVTQAEVALYLRAKNELSAVLAKVSGDLGHLEQQASKASGGLGGLGNALGKVGQTAAVAGAAIGAGVAAGVGVGVKAAGDLEHAVAGISTIKPEIDTSAVFNSLNELSTKVPQTASELADSLYDVFSSIGNITTEQGLALTETFAKGAVGAQTDAKTFGTAISGILNAYKLDVEDAAAVSDMFFATVRDGVVTGPELAASLGPVTQAARAMGVEWKDLGPLIAAVTKEGGPAAQNINNLNNTLSKLGTSEAQVALEKIGVATKTASGEFRDVPAILRDLKGALESLTEAERANALQTIFPDAQARQGAATLMSQLDFVDQALQDSAANAGLSEAAYSKMSSTFNSQSKLLMNTLTSIATTIGAEVLPSLTPMIAAFSKTLPDAFKTVKQVFAGQWAPDPTQIDPFVNKLGEVALVVRDQVVPAIGNLVTWLGTNLPPVVTWLSETAWPALVSAGDALGTKLGEITQFFSDLMGELQERGVFTELQETWKNLGEIAGLLGKNLTESVNPQMETLSGKAITNRDVMLEFATNITTAVKELNAAVTALKNFGIWLDSTKKTLGDWSIVLSGFTGGNVIEAIKALGRLTGRNFTGGVEEGVKEGQPAVEAAAAKVADSVPSIFSDRWEERSPSKVAINLGSQFTAGLAVGIGQGGGIVSAAGLKVARDVIAAISPEVIPGEAQQIGASLPAALAAGVNAQQGVAVGAGRELGGAMIQAIAPSLQGVAVGAGRQMGGIMIQAIAPPVEAALVKIGKDVPANLAAGMFQATPVAVGAGVTMNGKLIQAFAPPLAAAGLKAGGSIPDQMAAGVRAGTPLVVASIESMVQQALAAFNKGDFSGVRDIFNLKPPPLLDSSGAPIPTTSTVAPATRTVSTGSIFQVPTGTSTPTSWPTALFPPKFDVGGIVPGPIGAPLLAYVHGGETITPPGRLGSGGGGNVTINGPLIGSATIREEADVKRLANELGDIMKDELSQVLGQGQRFPYGISRTP